MQIKFVVIAAQEDSFKTFLFMSKCLNHYNNAALQSRLSHMTIILPQLHSFQHFPSCERTADLRTYPLTVKGFFDVI